MQSDPSHQRGSLGPSALSPKPISDHEGQSHAYYLHVPFDESLRRHLTKPQASEYGEAEMRAWYRGLDLLPGGIEQVIAAKSTLEQTVTQITTDTRLSQYAVQDSQGPGRT